MTSGSSPQAGSLPDRPGTLLAFAQKIPVDPRRLGLVEALGKLFQKHLASAVVCRLAREVTRPNDCQISYLT